MSRKDPPRKLELPEHKECEVCGGTGEAPNTMNYEMVCDPCGGAGRVNAETGERLDQGIALVLNIRKFHHQQRTIKRMAEELNALKAKEEYEFDPYGNLPDRDGGKWRMD